MPKYSVEQAAPATVASELSRIWDDNLTLAGGAGAKFAWLYHDAPEPTQTVFLLRTDDGTAVGTAGVLARRFRVRGRDERAAILADLAVDTAHRQLLPALSLVREGKKYAESAFAFAYGYPNKLAEGVFKRAGYKELGRMTRYARVLRHADYAERLGELDKVPPAVARAVANPVVAKVAGAVADVGMLAKDAPQAARALASHKLEWLDAIDERIDELWRSARDEYQVIGERSAEVLRWRYPPRDPAQLALLVARKGGAPCAYALIQRDGDAAHVRDLFGHRDSLPALLDLLVPALYRQGATSASIRFLGNPAIAELLQSRGFQPRQSDRMLAITAGAAAPSDLLEVSNFHLLDFDEDA